MYTLKKSEVKPEFKAKGIQRAGRKLDILKLSKEERDRYERHIGNARNSQSILETYYMDGQFDGRAEGRAEGRQEGEVALLTRQLKRRFSEAVTQEYLQLLEGADEATLSQWGENLIDAKDIDDVFKI